MSQPAKAQEPSMEEILASIRRIIADDDASKPPAEPASPPAAMAAPLRAPDVPPRAPTPPPAPAPKPAAAQPAPPSVKQSEIDEMIAGLDAPPGGEEAARDSQDSQDSHDILELTESMTAPAAEPDTPSFQTIDGQSDVVFSDAPAHPERAPEEPRRPPAQSNGPDRSLLSSATSAAVDSAFNTLAQTVLVHNARTLEDLVREMLRPMLKSWLDDNLPGMVERIIRAEIERVSRGRG